MVASLLAELGEEVPAGLVERAKVLDHFYIPARYPNGHPAGAPLKPQVLAKPASLRACPCDP